MLAKLKKLTYECKTCMSVINILYTLRPLWVGIHTITLCMHDLNLTEILTHQKPLNSVVKACMNVYLSSLDLLNLNSLVLVVTTSLGSLSGKI